jgi:hypothetical protein
MRVSTDLLGSRFISVCYVKDSPVVIYVIVFDMLELPEV